MSITKEKTVISLGALACVAYCLGPVLGLLAAIGIGAAAGYALFGGVSLIVGVVAVVYVIRRYRQQRSQSGGASSEFIAVEMPTVRSSRKS